jgi:hypothetical protein
LRLCVALCVQSQNSLGCGQEQRVTTPAREEVHLSVDLSPVLLEAQRQPAADLVDLRSLNSTTRLYGRSFMM